MTSSGLSLSIFMAIGHIKWLRGIGVGTGRIKYHSDREMDMRLQPHPPKSRYLLLRHAAWNQTTPCSAIC